MKAKTIVFLVALCTQQTSNAMNKNEIQPSDCKSQAVIVWDQTYGVPNFIIQASRPQLEYKINIEKLKNNEELNNKPQQRPPSLTRFNKGRAPSAILTKHEKNKDMKQRESYKLSAREYNRQINWQQRRSQSFSVERTAQDLLYPSTESSRSITEDDEGYMVKCLDCLDRHHILVKIMVASGIIFGGGVTAAGLSIVLNRLRIL